MENFLGKKQYDWLLPDAKKILDNKEFVSAAGMDLKILEINLFQNEQGIDFPIGRFSKANLD